VTVEEEAHKAKVKSDVTAYC